MADETPDTPAADSQPAAPSQEGAPPSQESGSPPSSGDTGQSKESLLDAVLKVVPATNETDVLEKPAEEKAAPPDAAQSPDDGDQAETDTDEVESEDDEPAPPEMNAVVRKKFNKLLKQRRELRGQVAALEVPAQIGSQIQAFAQQNDLSDDDITNTLQIAAYLRVGDYQSFYQAVAPFVRTAQEVLGVVLPRDLADRVRAGHMTEAAAKDFARQRHNAERANYERQAVESAQSVQTRQYVQNDVQRAVSALEYRFSANDPDYKAKAPAVRRTAQAILFERGGKIATVEEALQITRAAYDEVNRQMRSIQPRPQATRPAMNGATQTPSARAAPKSLMEAALQGLENSRRGG